MSAVAARDRIILGGCARSSPVRHGGLTLLALFSLPAVPPTGELAAPAPHDRKVDRQHEQPERDHPEPEHGQEPDKTADDEENADRDADRFRLRQMPVAIEDADLVGHRLRAAGLTKAGDRELRGTPQPRPPDARPSDAAVVLFLEKPGEEAAEALHLDRSARLEDEASAECLPDRVRHLN